MPHIAVIGGGITGVTMGYALADRGFDDADRILESRRPRLQNASVIGLK